MEKREINEILREGYVLNEPLDEETFQEKNSELYSEIISVYGTWDKALKLNGITHKKIKERKKFITFWVMKGRHDKFGDEALRPKNIEPDMKEKISERFGTLKNMQDTVRNWNRDRVLYETRKKILTGTTFEEMTKEPTFYAHIQSQFGSLEALKEEYEDRFEIRTMGTRVSRRTKEDTQDLLTILVSNGFADEKQVEDIIAATQLSKEETIAFLLDEVSEARRNKEPITEEAILMKNAAMIYAIRAWFGGLQEAFEEAAKTLMSNNG